MEVKTYTSIFDKAKAAHGTGAYDDATLEFLFPELKVSEDERMLRAIIRGFENWKSNGNLTFNLTDVDDILAYLERQKESKPEWSEADEKQIRQIERIVKDAGCSQKLQEQIHNWFKSLRPQSHWKPTEEQMKAFKSYIEDSQSKAEAAVGGWDNLEEMIRLYEQLKKL